jgi:hypothetical protein
MSADTFCATILLVPILLVCVNVLSLIYFVADTIWADMFRPDSFVPNTFCPRTKKHCVNFLIESCTFCLIKQSL